ncbi:hypothetical protein ACT3S2_05725 [Arthrobacter sp. AOP36-A1-22]|uniref:hypothetical protein n=1 Tax=unclassified Arthrobacter TaxID=235627 RepID=UPI00264E4A85|nr:hypothetical protein [Micrococcaceae bacterium]MDN5879171.1 hypothetical protein [Micrococcaceae bacterium]
MAGGAKIKSALFDAGFGGSGTRIASNAWRDTPSLIGNFYKIFEDPLDGADE